MPVIQGERLQVKDHQFPMTIKRGSTAVKIYRSEAGAYETFTLAYYDGSKRKRQNFSDFAEAKREAESIATKLCRGELDVLTLSSEDRALYVRACEALRPTGVSLDVAAKEYAEAFKQLVGRPVLETISIPQVALEAGNSVAMVNKHYRELVTPEEAKAWFSIVPETSANVVPMSLAAMEKEAEFVTNLSRKPGQLL